MNTCPPLCLMMVRPITLRRKMVQEEIWVGDGGVGGLSQSVGRGDEGVRTVGLYICELIFAGSTNHRWK